MFHTGPSLAQPFLLGSVISLSSSSIATKRNINWHSSGVHIFPTIIARSVSTLILMLSTVLIRKSDEANKERRRDADEETERETTSIQHSLAFPTSLICYCNHFRYVRKIAKSDYMVPVCLSVCPHGTTRLPLNGLSSALIFDGFSRISRKCLRLVKVWKE